MKRSRVRRPATGVVAGAIVLVSAVLSTAPASAAAADAASPAYRYSVTLAYSKTDLRRYADCYPDERFDSQMTGEAEGVIGPADNTSFRGRLTEKWTSTTLGSGTNTYEDTILASVERFQDPGTDPSDPVPWTVSGWGGFAGTVTNAQLGSGFTVELYRHNDWPTGGVVCPLISNTSDVNGTLSFKFLGYLPGTAPGGIEEPAPDKLRADPGGPYSAVRTLPTDLDGSGSTPAMRIKRY